MAARGRTARETGPSADEPLYCATFSREMQLENSFQVGAPPERVFEYLLDINKVVGCVPGAELSEVVDQSTFKGKVKVKVGPITVAYSGSARATAQMHVQTAGEGSLVRITTEYHVAGRVAQFGRGVMEDVSKRLVNDMAKCIQANLEADYPALEDDVAAAVSRSSAAQATVRAAQPVSAFGLLLHLIAVRFRRLFGRGSA